MRVREVAEAVAEEVPKIVEVEVEVLVVAAGDGRPDQVCWEVQHFSGQKFSGQKYFGQNTFLFWFVFLGVLDMRAYRFYLQYKKANL